MSEFTWKTKEGKRLKLNEIGDRHLDNIVAMLERDIKRMVGKKGYYACVPKYAGMEPGDYLDTEYYSANDLANKFGLPTLKQEQIRRHIKANIEAEINLYGLKPIQQTTGVQQ